MALRVNITAKGIIIESITAIIDLAKLVLCNSEIPMERIAITQKNIINTIKSDYVV
ncbi:MAG: hypothetical protein QXJ96_00635 [Candidatus Aenigmatarchaeota archaeon]